MPPRLARSDTSNHPGPSERRNKHRRSLERERRLHQAEVKKAYAKESEEKNDSTPEYQQAPIPKLSPKPKQPTWLWQKYNLVGTHGQKTPTNVFKCSHCDQEIEVPESEKPEPCTTCNK